MKFDEYGALVREKERPPGDWWSNLGDSFAETFRVANLRGEKISAAPFITDKGFVRHPKLAAKPGWDERDMSADNLLPAVLNGAVTDTGSGIFIRGTWTIKSPGLVAAEKRWNELLQDINQFQGKLLSLKYRVGDGFKIEKSEGSVQDYLNMIQIWVALGKRGPLPRPADECMRAIRKYYLEGDDWEPNSEWIVDLYERNLRPGTPPDESLP